MFLERISTAVKRKFTGYSDKFPDKKADIIWRDKKVIFYLVHNNIDGLSMQERMLFMLAHSVAPAFSSITGQKWWNGYCRFKESPTMSKSICGLLAFVPVYGGLNYAEADEDNSITFGFSTNSGMMWDVHEYSKTNDLAWLKKECCIMAKAIKIASRHEEDYAFAANGQARMKIVVDYLGECKDAGIHIRIPGQVAISEMMSEISKDREEE